MKKYVITFFAIVAYQLSNAQEVVSRTLPFDPNQNKLIPDKVFEFGVPMVFLILILNTIVTVLKNRADQQLKLKMVEKGISEETLIQIFKESNAIAKLQSLKYFLVCIALGISLIVIHFCKDALINQSGYMALGIILTFTSISFFIYYQILQRKA